MKKLLFLALFFSFHVSSIFAQEAGALDTSFKVRQNYGAIYPILKTWPLADGSVMCYSQYGNQFGNQRTGDFFKIKPDGQLDASYKTARLGWQCFAYCWNETCRFNLDQFICLPKGEIYAGWYYVENDNINYYNYPNSHHLFSNGSLDSTFSKRFTYKSIKIFQQPQFFALQDGKNKIFKHDLASSAVDSFSHPDFDSVISGVYFLESKHPGIQAFLGYRLNQIPYIFYFDLTNNQISRKESRVGNYLIGMDKKGRVYGTNSSVYPYQCKRQNLDGSVDTNFVATHNFQDIQVDSSGKLFKKIGEGRTEITLIQFDDSTGLPVTSSKKKEYFEIVFPQKKITLERDENVRFHFTATDQNGTPLIEKYTRYGANDQVVRTLADSAGRAIILGHFTEFDQWNSQKLARVLTNGQVDTTFFCNQFRKEDNIKPIMFQFFPNGKDLLLINRYPIGKWNRYIFKILPNGMVDSSYAINQGLILTSPVSTTKSACNSADGSVYFTYRQFMGERIARILPNGFLDQTFLSSYSISTNPNWESYNTTLAQMEQGYLVGEVLKSSGDNPPPSYCPPPPRSPNESHFQRINLDGSIASNPFQSINLDYYDRVQANYPNLGILISKDYYTITRIKTNGTLDTNYVARYPNGSDFTKYNNSSIAFLQEGKNQVVYALDRNAGKLIKLDPSGILDTTFVTNLVGVGDVREIDSLSLYVSGHIIKKENQVFEGFLAKLHNKPTIATGVEKQGKEAEFIQAYPNPVEEELSFRSLVPEFAFQIFNLQGKCVYTGNPEKTLNLNSIGLPPGFYFWSASAKGKFKGSGKLVKK